MTASKWTFLIEMVAVTLLICGPAQAEKLSPENCSNLREELRAMQVAQKTLLTNMVQNNQTMATTLEDYSTKLKESSKIRRPITSKDVSSLHQSADAFRSHGARESKLIAKFNQASEGLMKRVETCLSN